MGVKESLDRKAASVIFYLLDLEKRPEWLDDELLAKCRAKFDDNRGTWEREVAVVAWVLSCEGVKV